LVVWLSSLLPPLQLPYQVTWVTILLFYLIATIALHIFPSRRDMAAWPVIGILTLIGGYILIRYATVSPLMYQLIFGLGMGIASAIGLIVLIGIIHRVGRLFVSVQ